MARILFIAYTTYIHDGRVKRHAEALAERGDDVDVISLATEEHSTSNGVNVIGVSMPRYRGSRRSSYLGSYARFFMKAALISFRRQRDRPYQVVIACTMPDAAILAALPSKLFGSKVILDVHDTMPELYMDKFGGKRGMGGARMLMVQERVSASLSDRVLAVHELHAARLVEAGVPAKKITVVINAPDPRIFKSPAEGKRGESAFTLVCHGTVTRRLGLDIAVQAIGILRDRLGAIRFDIIGSGDYLVEIKAMVAKLNLESQINFLGMIPIEELPAVLGNATVGLIPNRATTATQLMLPVKMLEYAALGIPAIASRLRTIEHYFGDSAARYFEPNNPEDLARAIEELYYRPDRRLELIKRARQVAKDLDWSIQRTRLFEAVDSTMLGQGNSL